MEHIVTIAIDSAMPVQVIDEDFKKFVQVHLYNKLQETFDSGALLDVSELRNVGKTATLIAFAKTYSYPVVVAGTESDASTLRREHDYKYIFTSPKQLITSPGVLVDEGVNVEDFKGAGIKILGGYLSFL